MSSRTSVRVVLRWIYDGLTHEVGSIVQCKDEDVAASVACGLVEVVGEEKAQEPSGDGTPPSELDSLIDQWELEMAPAEYLERYPKAKHAALAKQIIEAQQRVSPPVDEE